jgi:hypothetical protein
VEITIKQVCKSAPWWDLSDGYFKVDYGLSEEPPAEIFSSDKEKQPGDLVIHMQGSK